LLICKHLVSQSIARRSRENHFGIRLAFTEATDSATFVRIALGDYLLHKCANPACSVSFRDIHVGKLFLVETSAIFGESKVRHRVRATHQHYWLCDQCSRGLTLMFEKERGIIPVPLSSLSASGLAHRPPVRLTTINNSMAREVR